MSADTKDYSLIHDEDVLKRMWQDTDDFGRKKEIRAHMYKLREARLRDFYNTGEVTSESIIKTSKSTSKGTEMTHADSLADHSFLSLKSKEIRDSESPTKDAYKISDISRKQDQGWNIVESNKTSNDGKTHTTTRVATTSGKQSLEGGEANYAAKSEQKASVYHDGDDKNFTKAASASTHNVIKQEAHGGDDNTKFYSTSTTTKSSSKYSSEQRSSSGDVDTKQLKGTEAIPSGETVVRKVYTENIPNEFKNNPNFIDGKTKVTTETKTLQDGSTVTTTRYETVGSKSYSSSSSSRHATEATRAAESTRHEQKSSNRIDSHDSRRSSAHDDVRIQISPKIDVVGNTQTSTIAKNQEVVDNRRFDDSDVRRVQDIRAIGRDVCDANVKITKVTTESRQTEEIKPVTEQSTVTKTVRTIHTRDDQKTQPITDENIAVTKTITKTVHTSHDDQKIKPSADDNATITRTTVTKTFYDDQSPTVTKTVHVSRGDQNIKPTIDDNATITRTTVTKTYYDDKTPTDEVTDNSSVTRTTVTKNINSKYDTQKATANDFITTERQHVTETNLNESRRPTPAEIIEVADRRQPIRPIEELEISKEPMFPKKEEPKYETPERRQPFKPTQELEISTEPMFPKREEPTYDTPERRQPYKPEKSEMDEKRALTEGQYETTYRTDYVPRRISVEVSPTHDAFVRSLRSVSPDRNSRSGSIRSLRTPSQSSLRSSPEKYRTSPDQYKPGKKRTPDKYSSTETFTKTYDRRTPEPARYIVNTTVVRKSPENTTNTTRKFETKTGIDSSTLTRRNKKQSPARSPSPTTTASEIEFVRNTEVTDLDAKVKSTNVTDTKVFRDTKITRRHTEDNVTDRRPTSLEVTTTRKKKITERSPTSPLSDFTPRKAASPSKDVKRRDSKDVKSPEDVKSKKTFRRTDTYEERCKEILGILDKESAPRKPSLPDAARVKVSREPSETISRGSPEKSPVKTVKEPTKIQEFPSQIRKSPHKEPLEPYLERKRPGKDTAKLQEFPSQIRKSPQREPLEAYPEKTKTTRDSPKIHEFPSQVRRSPQKEQLESNPRKASTPKEAPKLNEFPSQIRKTPQREPLEPYPEKTKDLTESPTICEFPSQIRRSPQREPLEPYSDKAKTPRDSSKLNEFPSQVRRSPQKEPLEPFPEKNSAPKSFPKINEFPSQIRKSPEKLLLEPYPEKTTTPKDSPKIVEFPSQIRKPTERQPLEPYPEKIKPCRESPNINEFPSQIRKSPEKGLLEPYPEKIKPGKTTPTISEFPSQVKKEKSPSPSRELRKSPDRVSLDDLPLLRTDRRTPDRVSLSDLECRTEKAVDSFIRKEKLDTEITLSQYNDQKISKKNTKKGKTKKTTVTTIEVDDSSSTSEDEEETTEQIIDIRETSIPQDMTEVESIKKVEQKQIFGTTKTAKSVKKLSEKAKPSKQPQRKETSSTKPSSTITEVVTIKKTQVLGSKKPVDEPPTVKKFVPTLCPGEEVYKTTQVKTTTREKLQTVKGIPVEEEQPHRIFEKDSPEKILRSKTPEKEKPRYITDRTTKTTKKTDKFSGVTEYTDQYSKTTKIESKPTTRVITKLTITPAIRKDDTSTITSRVDTTKKFGKVVQNGDITSKQKPTTKTQSSTSERIQKTLTQTSAKTRPITKTTVQRTVEAIPSSRHVVSTIINLKPKSKPETITRTVHKTTAVKTISSKPKIIKTTATKTERKPLQNGHIPSDEEETDEDEIIGKRKKTLKPEKKCITTKSILIENAVADEREIIVDLKRSKSSREGTPDRICPYPVTSENVSGIPRYPDKVTEPEEPTSGPQPNKITNDVIHEDMEGFGSIVGEVKEEKVEIDEKDECLLSVNEKVSKFLTTAENITKRSKDLKPAPKVDRPILDVDEHLQEDECLLSVSDKVSKFITTAEQLTKSKQTDRSKRINLEDVDIKVDENAETPRSVSERVSHFITTAEHIKETPTTKPEAKEPVTLSKLESVKRSPSPKKETSRPTITECTTIETEKHMTSRRSESPEKPKYTIPEESLKKSPSRDYKTPSPTRRASSTHETTQRRISDVKRTEEVTNLRRDSLETTPKSSRRASKDEPRTVLSPTGRLRSTETIKKAKALFENIGREQEILKQRDILTRPSVFEGRRIEEQRKLQERKITREDAKTTHDETEISKETRTREERSRSPEKQPKYDDDVPHYMTPLDRTMKEQKPRLRSDDRSDGEEPKSRESSVDRGDVPHYMLPLDRSLRERSPHKENVKQLEEMMMRSTTSSHNEEVDSRTTKFGVTLRRTDSGRVISQKKVITNVENQEEIDIEEIFDLEYLEKLLETVVGYDIRRRIRAQIRIVKSYIEKSEIEVTKTSKSPSRNVKRETVETQESRGTSEYKSSYSSYTERRSSEIKSATSTRRSTSPEVKEFKSRSPERKTIKTETSKVFQTELKKTKPISKKIVDEKPEWVTQKTLKKVTNTPVKKTTTTTTTATKTSRSQKSPSKERAPTDVITSSYGVGPMDENGSPLFGLKALRAQNRSEKSKVQGTVIQSRYYSENGQEPIGEISITKYSTDPKDLPAAELKKEKGIASVTTTQKFGYKGTPSLKTITSKTKAVESGEASSTKSKVTRRGSVKEISQKFIENAVDTLKSERQTSYPKAGLILRTGSFKETSGQSPKSREGSPGYEETHRTVTTVKTTSTSGGKVDTFLSNKSRVSGVQDVITRMKNEEVEGDSPEDIEAKNLLNKFIGSQVLLSGMEACSKPAGSKRSTTKITTTTTTTESGKPTKTVTRTFTHPITAELLKTIWDEQTLNLLLEQSADYEDRRIIRDRLKEVMAEQEACADLVEKASEEVSRQESKSSINERTYSEGPLTTTSQVTTRVTTQQQQVTNKPMSPFAKFRQLDKQNSLNSPPSTPRTPTGSGSFFKFTDPALNQSANTVTQRLLQWCQMKTHGYENIQLNNFSTSWADGMAFCALIHHFLPDAFDYNALNPKNRRHNFTLAFQVADDKAGIAPLLDVDDMVAISKPDWKCVFTYVQSIYRRFKDED